MECPRCGFAAESQPACPRCGVVFAKLKNAAAPADPPVQYQYDDDEDEPKNTSTLTVVAYVLVAATLLVAGLAWLRPQRKPAKTARTESSSESGVSRGPSAASGPKAPASEAPPPVVMPVASALPPAKIAGLAVADAKLYETLVERVNKDLPLSSADVESANTLLGRYAGDKRMEALLMESLLRAAQQQQRTKHTAEAVAYLRRAAVLPWADSRSRAALLSAVLQTLDWGRLEAQAQELLATNSRDAESWYYLGYALFRQDRIREATQALKSCLEVQDHAEARGLLARIERNKSYEEGMAEQQLSHFHVRYDGAAHDEVGREILRALERHYATLVRALDHEPQTAVPVILFTSAAFFDAAGAPAWSGGAYDTMDGNIRVPIGGLDRNLTPEMDSTLLHELTHAFIADKTKDTAPRQIHEGLAQYMEGQRIASRLDRTQLAALADGRIMGVGGFYMESLSFVEYLIERRGQGGINDLLKAMGDTRDVDAAFRQVQGQSFAASVQSWHDRIKQQYGS